MNTQDIQEKFFRDGKLIVIPKKLRELYTSLHQTQDIVIVIKSKSVSNL
ncbi:hypothetical protein ACTGXK_04995 [Streptococcus suis]